MHSHTCRKPVTQTFGGRSPAVTALLVRRTNFERIREGVGGGARDGGNCGPPNSRKKLTKRRLVARRPSGQLGQSTFDWRHAARRSVCKCGAGERETPQSRAPAQAARRRRSSSATIAANARHAEKPRRKNRRRNALTARRCIPHAPRATRATSPRSRESTAQYRTASATSPFERRGADGALRHR